MEEVPKVVLLSHSSANNLTKHWRNAVAIEPVDTPCFPCHKLHYGWETCNRVESTKAAMCASNIAPERVFKAVAAALGAQLAEAAD
jgi:hypothetical protein